MTINYMTGAIFEDGYIEAIDKMNQKYSPKTQTNEVYGSLSFGYSGLPTARPDFRFRYQLDWDGLEKYIENCHKHQIMFTYAMNAPNTEGLKSLKDGLPKLVESLKRLESMGVDRIIVASPLLAEIVCENTNLPVELSTILHIFSLHSVPFYSNNYSNVDTICPNLYRNRDIGFVKKMNKECDKHDIRLQVMATEFCTAEGTPCLGAYRMNCYDLHGKNQNKDDAKLFRSYPMGRCIFKRAADTTTWLKSRVIFPNEVEEYCERTGVSHLKITTRTAPKGFGLEILEHYMKCQYDGNMMGLWMQLQTILAKDEKFDTIQENSATRFHIDCKKLSEPLHNGMKFYDKWFKDPDFRCDENSCEECKWCPEWAEILVGSDKKEHQL